MTRKNLRTVREGVVAGISAYALSHLIFMTAVAAAYYLLVPFAHAQTYVRPSKGAAISIFATAPVAPNVWANYPTVATAGAIDVATQGYDWTSFEAVQVRIFGTGGAVGCTSRVEQYAVPNLAPYVRFHVVKAAASDDLYFRVEDSPVKDPITSYITSFSPNGNYLLTTLAGCTVGFSVVPLPFAQPSNPTLARDGTILAGGITNSSPSIMGGVDAVTGRVTTANVSGTTRALKVDASGSPAASVTVTNPFALNSTVATSNTWLQSIDTKLTAPISTSISGTPTVALSTSNNYIKDTPFEAAVSVAPVVVDWDAGDIITTLARPGIISVTNVGAYGAVCAYNRSASATIYSFVLKAQSSPTALDGGTKDTPLLIPGSYVRCRSTGGVGNTTGIAFSVATY